MDKRTVHIAKGEGIH